MKESKKGREQIMEPKEDKKDKGIDAQKFINSVSVFTSRAEIQNENFDYLGHFVPLISLEALKTKDSQILYGRNGSGKTHYFMAFKQYLEKEFEKHKILGIYINLKNSGLGPVLTSISSQEFVNLYYRRILLQILNSLQEFGRKKLTPDLLSKMGLGDTHKRRKIVRESIKSLTWLLDEGSFEKYLKQYTEKLTKENKNFREASANVKLSLPKSLEEIQESVNLEAKAEAKLENVNAAKIDMIYATIKLLDHQKIQKEIHNIIETLQLEGIYILIDEWSDTNLSIQPILADVIKRTLCFSPKISLKIAALRFFTQLSAPIEDEQSIGLVPGIDIFEAADIDHVLNSPLKKAPLTGFHATAKHIAAKAVSPSSETMRTI